MTPQATRSWKEWAVDFIRATDQCPGTRPSVVGETDESRLAEQMTESQFLKTFRGTHSADSCGHFMDERLGVVPAPDLREIKGVGASPVTEADVARGKKMFVEGADERADDLRASVECLKKELHGYVDRISVRDDGGRLTIPSQLMYFEKYLQEHFNLNR